MLEHPLTMAELLVSLRHSGSSVHFPETSQVVAHRDMAGRALAVAERLRGNGVGCGDLVGLLMPTAPQWLDGFFGATLTGAAATALPLPPVVLDPAAVADQLAPIVTAGRIRHLLVSGVGAVIGEALAVRCPGLTIVELDRTAVSTVDGEPPFLEPDSLAVVQFSSGSTARPKGVMLTHRQYLFGVASLNARIESCPSDVLVQWVPLFHDMGMVSLLCSLMAASDVHLFGAHTFIRQPERVLTHIAEVGGTVTSGPNFAFDKFVRVAPQAFTPNADERPLARLRLAFNGAEPVRARTIEEFHRVFGPLGVAESVMYPGYGMAEATLAVTLPLPGNPPRTVAVDRDHLMPGRPVRRLAAGAERARELVSVGVPVTGMKVRISDESGVELPDGHVGEIHINGPAVTSGYLYDEQTTAAALHDGWLRTGDLGFFDEGELVIAGRSKEMIIAQGRNFFPDDVEEAARTVAGVHKGRCVAVADVEREQLVVVAESPHDPGTAEHDQTCKAIRGAVSRALALSSLDVLLVPQQALPRTSSGKWQRALIASMVRQHLATREQIIAAKKEEVTI